MNRLQDTATHGPMHLTTHDLSPTSLIVPSYEQQNILLQTFEDHAPNFFDSALMMNSHQTHQLINDLKSFCKSENPSLSQDSFMSHSGIFNITSGKRSPPVVREGNQKERSVLTNFPKQVADGSQHIYQSTSNKQNSLSYNNNKRHKPQIAKKLNLFHGFHKSSSKVPQLQSPLIIQDQQIQKDKAKILCSNIKLNDPRIFIKHFKAKKNFFKIRSGEHLRVFDYSHQCKQRLTRYKCQMSSFTSESMNECVSSKFYLKNLQTLQQNSNPEIQINQQNLNLLCPELPLSSLQDISHHSEEDINIREQNFNQSLDNQNNHSQHNNNERSVSSSSQMAESSNNSGSSSISRTSSEDRTLFRIFTGLHVFSVNTTQQLSTTASN
ncbi:UNKNOWN [Stylonychia lemnae]|uniref:Uncharacterized protein n=1 Tax=Stylonychia lemnae TaxID=5949 RepID=A0A078B5Q7_STYLE|nr:UNKNOWN [Stylonychia lemnae]|eukprot:CDW88848.1 UNKNOWN [Stylonychia lemnae]